ncbi:hypothetical protein Calkro_0406 [Caldicellulosiruptor kronotskyensis 2002]|uniref:DUF2092 domain-containing protein n=1 Tax=Caldicellulosiruptor kronotskyensis (strain DSM 18902 / VKM B-2412 / 2002) TaxID=632348 RepID=E4SE19_CALK2|nr:hypothetical protein [Caldicellulosiruptor kronotskyensis]ADQ45306.1 hypothetical protein Calkro_0406 [Caldicellulosiruptor kronotskyensis 2002]
MKRLLRLISSLLVVLILLSMSVSYILGASNQQSQTSLLEKSFKAELAKILNPDSPLSCDIISSSSGQKSLGYGLNLAINDMKTYKIAFDRKNKKLYVQTKKDNVNQAVFINGQNVYRLDPKDNKYTHLNIPTNLWMSINIIDSTLTQPVNKLYQNILNYLGSQSSSIVKSAVKTTTSVGSKKITCWQLSANLPSKILEPAFKEFLSTSSKSVISQLKLMFDIYLKSLTDDEKKALSSLNIDVNKISSADISKQLEIYLSKIIASLKLDDYKIIFYIDEKTGKIVKLIIKNLPSTGSGILSRVEISNIQTGNDVKFPQIPQNMIKTQSNQVDIVGILKLIENFVSKMQQIK